MMIKMLAKCRDCCAYGFSYAIFIVQIAKKTSLLHCLKRFINGLCTSSHLQNMHQKQDMTVA